eukprot:scaffold41446_cov73-Attheya_sp.AAC.3
MLKSQFISPEISRHHAVEAMAAPSQEDTIWVLVASTYFLLEAYTPTPLSERFKNPCTTHYHITHQHVQWEDTRPGLYQYRIAIE